MNEETNTEKLARWSCTLNSWEWPHDLLGKPDGFDGFPDTLKNQEEFSPNKYDWISSIMKKIENRIGNKEVLRWHHIHNLNRTNDEFESWWSSEKL